MAVNIRDRSAWAHDIGERVRATRLERQWSQEKLGRVTEFSRVTIDRVEKGRSLAGVDTLAVIAEALGVSVVWLLYGEEDSATRAYFNGSILSTLRSGDLIPVPA